MRVSVHALFGRDSGRFSDLGNQGLRGYTKKDMISVQATACTEKKGFAYLPDLPLKRKHRRSGAKFQGFNIRFQHTPRCIRAVFRESTRHCGQVTRGDHRPDNCGLCHGVQPPSMIWMDQEKASVTRTGRGRRTPHGVGTRPRFSPLCSQPKNTWLFHHGTIPFPWRASPVQCRRRRTKGVRPFALGDARHE